MKIRGVREGRHYPVKTYGKIDHLFLFGERDKMGGVILHI